MTTAIFGLNPVGAVIAWLKSYTNTPSLSAQGRTEYVECNGQTLSDAQSVYNGQVIPNLNNSGGAGSNVFLRGNTVSGGTGGSLCVSLSATVSLCASLTTSSASAGITLSGNTDNGSANLSQSTAVVDTTGVGSTVSALTYDQDSGHSHGVGAISVNDPTHAHGLSLCTSASLSGSTTAQPPYYDVVWIVRIK